jgi:hypothetical protein
MVWLVLAVFGASVSFAYGEDQSVSSGDLKVQADGDHVDFLVKGKLMARYECGPKVAKPYFWPLNSPAGEPITRAWPMEPLKPGGTKDHVHQKSAWFCHGDVIPEGIELKEKVKGVTGVDFWDEAKGHGIITCTQKGPIESNGHQAKLATHNEWRTADGIKILDEDRVISFTPLPDDAYLIVFDIDMAATGAPLTFGDTKEGSFGIRINDAIREQGGNGKLTNAAGKTGEKQVWGMRSPWCDYSGELNGKKVGLAIFDDPSNPPSCWHSRGYGLMAANPFGRGHSGFPAVKGQTDLLKLPKDGHLKLRYGLYVHPGDVKDGKVAEVFAQFAKKGSDK